MYETFYGLDSRPFLTSPDPKFLFWAEQHTLAFTMLRYGVMTRAPVTVVTGEIGAGKTTLLRQLLREMPQDLVVGLVSNMQTGRGELLHWIMMAFGQTFEDENYVRTMQRFQEFVVDTYASGKRVAVIVDEAQNLKPETLEELRMLSNINADGDDLIQIILVGQPQLRELLNRPELIQFSQRISADFHIGTLSSEEVMTYIQHRLQVAGAKWRIFPHGTGLLVHEATRGVPRLVNILCDLCLVYGFAAESKVISEGLLREFLNGAKRHGIYDQFSPLSEGPKLVQQGR